MPQTLTLNDLKEALKDAHVLRMKREFETEDGPSGVVAPPTYAGRVYAEEERNGKKYVQINSEAAEANRMEEAIYSDREVVNALREAMIVDIPTDLFDFTERPVFLLPHRIADGGLRSCKVDGEHFHQHPRIAEAFKATPRYATPLFDVSPISLVFGVDARAKGMKFPRIIRSRIMAEHNGEARTGSTASSGWGLTNIDDPIYPTAEGGFTFDPKQAVQTKATKKKDAEDAKQGGKKNNGPTSVKPSSQNLVQIPVSVEVGEGNSKKKLAIYPRGVYTTHIEQIATISLSALRQLSFPETRSNESTRDSEARAVLAALALYGLVGASQDYFLRSGCTLVPKNNVTIEVVKGGEVTSYDITPSTAREILMSALNAASNKGFFQNPPVRVVMGEELLKFRQKTIEKQARADAYTEEAGEE